MVGLDFGTTYSGFSCCNVANPKDIFTNDQWPGESGSIRTNTALQYDKNNNLTLWGCSSSM